MKFEKRFQAEIIPEWRIKYMNYKGLKKKLRHVRREKLAKDKEYMNKNQNNYTSNRISLISHNNNRPLSPLVEGAGISSSYNNDKTRNDKRLSFQSSTHHRTFTMNSVSDSLQDFVHKVSSALVAIQKQQNVPNSNYIPPPSKITSLDTLMEEVDTEERSFFTALNAELEKIDHFYKLKEIEATNRMNLLQRQYEILKEKKHEKKHWKHTSKAFVKQGFDYLKSQNTQITSGSLSEGSSTPSSSDEQQVYYKNAKKNIKKAIFEFYRGAELLRKYRILNYNGFSKILKRYDKITQRNGSQIYMKKVTSSYFVKSGVIKKLLKDAEDFYVNHFEGGSRSKAIQRLRMPNKSNKTYYPSVLRVGLFLGLALPALIQTFMNDGKDQLFLKLYSGPFLLIVFLLLLGVNKYIWTKVHINYKFIFEFNPRDNLDFRQYLELPAIIFLVLCYIMDFDVTNTIKSVNDTTYNTLLVIIVVAILFNPFRILYYSARRWFIFSTIRLLGSGILRVEFRDFFIADILTSLSYSLITVHYFTCKDDDENSENMCRTSAIVPFLGSLPYFLRFLQSCRRYKDTIQTKHLINVVKYSLNIFAILAAYFYFNSSNNVVPLRAVWVLLQLTASLYTFCWDVTMDWSLFRIHSENYLLRNELGFESHWLYYYAIISNFILRMTWTLLLIPYPNNHDINTIRVIKFVIALFEMLRRCQWCILRVENEHVNNCGQFRAVKEMPLPFQDESLEEDFEDENVDYDRATSLTSWTSWSRKLFPKRKLNPADGWKDFEPTKNTTEYMYNDDIIEESDDGDDDDDEGDDDIYDEDFDDKRNTISLIRMEGGHGLSNVYASRSFLPSK